MKKKNRKQPEVVEEWMVPFAEAQEIMAEYVHSIVLVGPKTPLSDTNYLGEETDEGGEEDSEPPVKKRDIRK